MAQVPTYDGEQVQLRPKATTPFQNPGDNSGSIVGAVLTSAGELAGQFSKIAAARQDAIDEAAVTDLDAVQEQAFTATLYGDGKSAGYFASQGLGAVDGERQTRDALTKIISDTSAKAATPQQKLMLSRLSQARIAKADAQIATHASKEAFSANLASKTAGAALYAESASALWASPQEQAGKIAVGLARLNERYELEGLDPQSRVLANLQYTSDIHANAVAQMIDVDPHAAEKYLLTHASAMTIKARTALTGPVRKAVIDKDAADFTSGVIASGAASAPGVGTGNPMSSAIQTAAAAQGVDPAAATVIAMVESGMDATAVNGSSKGVFQLQDARWREMGGTAADRDNPARQVELGVKSIKVATDRLTQKLGRAPQAWEIYMAHQQGDAGGPALLTAPPNVNAISVLEGIGVSPRMAKLSITQNGGREDMTAGEFTALWRDRFARKAASGSGVAATRPAATLTPNAPPDRASVLAMAKAASGGDPEREKALINAGMAGVSQLEAAKRDRENAADEQLQQYLRPGGARTLQDIPASLRAQLAPEKLTSLENHFAEGGEFAKKSDPTTQAYLSAMAATDPVAFAKEDMVKWAGKLSSGTYSSMLSLQRSARAGKGDFEVKALTINDLMRGATGVLVRNGLDPKKDKDQIGQLQQVMLDWGEQFVSQHKRRPSPTEINTALDGYLLQGTTEGGLWGRKVRVFQAGGAKTFTLSIPGEAERRIKADFQQSKGREPSRQEMVTIYRALHAAGKLD
jgi:hypothetical protein